MTGTPVEPRGATAAAAGTLAALALALAAGCGPSAAPAEQASAEGRPLPSGPSILLISADTLRADRVSYAGYARKTTPRLDAFAAHGLVFERAYAHASWTLPSHMTLFTSLLPTTHGVTTHLGYRDPAAVAVSLGESVVTLPELMQAAGYATAAFTEDGWLNAKFGFGRGFDVYEDARDTYLDRTCSRAIEFMTAPRPRPFFVFLHTYATHIPYAMPDEYLTSWGDPERQGLIGWGARPSSELLKKLMKSLFPPIPDDQVAVSDIYDGSVKYLDGCLGRLFDVVEQREPGSIAVIFTTDHGEEIFEHGRFGHGQDLWDEVLRVPLVVWAPGRVEAGRRRDPVGLVDVMPTLLELAGLAVPQGLAGVSLLRDPAEAEHPPIVAESWARDATSIQALVAGRHKLVRRAGRSPELELYDLLADPAERRDLAASEPELSGRLSLMLSELLLDARQRAVPVSTAPSVLTSDEIERLRALGYLH